MTGAVGPEYDEARWVLGRVSQGLPRARWELSRLRVDVLDAHVRLTRLASSQPVGRRPAPTERGVLLRRVVVSCEQGAAQSGTVDRELREAIAGLKAVAVLVDGGRARGTHEELAQVRLTRDLDDLRDQLAATRLTLATVTTALRETAHRTREVSPALSGPGTGEGGDGATTELERLHGMVLAASEQTRGADQDLDRAQVRTGQVLTQLATLAHHTGLRTRALRHDVAASVPSHGVPR